VVTAITLGLLLKLPLCVAVGVAGCKDGCLLDKLAGTVGIKVALSVVVGRLDMFDDPLGTMFGNPLGAMFGSPLGAMFGSSLGAMVDSSLGAMFGSPLGAMAGSPLGAMFGIPLGAMVDIPLGAMVGRPLGAIVGSPLCGAMIGSPLGAMVGSPLGAMVGSPLCGAMVGSPLGAMARKLLGDMVGNAEKVGTGTAVGLCVVLGSAEGRPLGAIAGRPVGAIFGETLEAIIGKPLGAIVGKALNSPTGLELVESFGTVDEGIVVGASVVDGMLLDTLVYVGLWGALGLMVEPGLMVEGGDELPVLIDGLVLDPLLGDALGLPLLASLGLMLVSLTELFDGFGEVLEKGLGLCVKMKDGLSVGEAVPT